MRTLIRFTKFIGVAALIAVGLIVLIQLVYLASPFGGFDLLLVQAITGFWHFLRENLPAISWDAGTWGPGVGAFSLAIAFAHRPLSNWAARTQRHWSFATTLCLALSIPVLFVISFLVPGVLLQWEILRQGPWIEIR